MEYAARALFSALTLYMMMILVRWLGGWLSFETDYGRWKWIAVATDPIVGRIRRVLPNLGPMDFAPMVTIFAVWIVRGVSLNLLLGPPR